MSQESKSFNLSAFEDCGVCCLLAKDYIKCVYCSEKACFDCYETYLLDQHVDKCMFCNKNWSYEFVQANFRPAFINGKYKDKKKVLMFEREKALLPATQTELAEEERYKAYTMKQRVLQTRVKVIQNDIKHYSKIARARASTKKEKDEALTMIDELLEKVSKLRDKSRGLYTAHYGEGQEEKKVEEVKREPVIPCSMNDCRGYLTRNNQERKLECGMCKTSHCHKCRCKKEEEHKCDPNIVETVKLLASDTKPCPKCSIPIFKIAGCDQMFCTGCHTAFSWKTGQIETGHIHNPHYWEYLQRQGRDLDGVRNMVGGVQNNFRNNNCLTLQDVVTEVSSTYFSTFVVSIMHMRHGTVQEADNVESNKDLRKRYLLNEIDEKNFKMVLFRREKKKKFDAELVQILNMIYDASKDLIISCYIRNFVENRYNKKTKFSIDLHDNVCTEIVNLCTYAEEQVEKLCKRFEYKKPQYVVEGIQSVIRNSEVAV
jgi:hypothetical protein